MADDRGQDVVEVVRHAPCKLADRLHLRRLGDLTLELRFLAVVLEEKKYRSVAKPSQASNRERYRFLRVTRQSNCDVAGHCRTAGVAADGIRDCRLVFLYDEVARIDRLTLHAGS